MDELVKTINMLKENKIEYFKQGELEIKFAIDAFTSDLTPLDSDEGNESDEDIMFLSSGVKRVKRDR